jgi:hypothetical protein
MNIVGHLIGLVLRPVRPKRSEGGSYTKEGMPREARVGLSLLAANRTFHFGLKHTAPSLTQI